MVSVLLLFAVCIVANAYDFRVDGIYYNVLSSEEQTCEVTGISTSNSNYSVYQGSVDIPNSVDYEGVTYTVLSIGDEAFYLCSKLTEVTIPNSVTSIGDEAFYNCTGLTEVTIPNSVTSMGDYAFYLCSKLTEVTIPNSVTRIGERAFYGCIGLTELTIGNSVTSIGDYAFYLCSKLTEVTIPNSVTRIGRCAFFDNALTKVNFNAIACTTAATFDDTINTINGKAFGSNISEVTIGDSVTKIPSFIFGGCSKLTEVTIPNSVTSIESYAFYECSGLTELTIGNSVTSIGMSAFSGCTGLNSITSLNPEPPACSTTSYGSFSGVPTRTCVLYVPEGSLGAYAVATGWRSFYNIVEVEVDAVADITAKSNAEATNRYTLDGKQISTPQRGLNVIHYSDGMVRKVLVK